MKYSEYWSEVSAFAGNLMQDEQRTYGVIEDFDNFKSTVLNNLTSHTYHHEWVVYSSFAVHILQHTDSKSEANELMSDLDLNDLFSSKGAEGIIQLFAAHCFHRDVEDQINDMSEEDFNELQDRTN